MAVVKAHKNCFLFATVSNLNQANNSVYDKQE